MNSSDVASGIEEFAVAFDALPDVPEPPRTTLDVLRERTGEKYWNRLLRYFLDPSGPHGLGIDLLRGFVELIEAEVDTAGLSSSALTDAQVASEVSSNAGRPDLLVWLPEEWFICIELKVTASESGTQTREYAASSQLGEVTVSDYPDDGQQYVYLTKTGRSPPSADAFTHIYWDDVQRIIGDVLQASHGRYPSRTTSQLSEFRDTIRDEIMSDTPYDTQQAKYVELYLEHADAIDSVQAAFEDMVDQQVDEWATRFEDEYRPPSWDGTWNADPDKYGKLYKNSWRRNQHGDPVDGWSDAAYRLEFRHKIRNHSSWKSGTLTFQTVIPRNSNDEYRTRIQDAFNDQVDQFQDICDRNNITIKGEQRTLTETTYSFNPQDGPNAYYSTLRTAFEDHQPLVEPLTNLYDTTYNALVE